MNAARLNEVSLLIFGTPREKFSTAEVLVCCRSGYWIFEFVGF
jgi:hypothetical protein